MILFLNLEIYFKRSMCQAKCGKLESINEQMQFTFRFGTLAFEFGLLSHLKL